MKTILGDITSIDKGLVLHQVNCQNAMGSGVAKALFLKHPSVKSEYHIFCEGKTPEELLGSLQEVQITPELSVLNSFSQLTYGWKHGIVNKQHTNLDTLVSNIEKGVAQAELEGKTLYIPARIGCVRGGASWEDLVKRIEHLNLTVIDFGK